MALNKEQVLAKIEAGESLAGVEIGKVDFSRHVFEKPVNFSGAKFTKKASFSSRLG